MTRLPTQAGQSAVEVRGRRAFTRSARVVPRACSVLVDLCIGTIAFLALLRYTGAVPIPALWWPLASFPAALLCWAAGRAGYGVSLGERALALRAEPSEADSGFAGRFGLGVLQSGSSGSGLTAVGTFLTAAALVSVPAVFWGLNSGDPIWLRASLERQVAEAPAVSDHWVVSPFYYALGVWPTRFEGSPIFFSIPYEKGPPSRFIGHLIARWDSPDIRVTFEGPRTPLAFAEGKFKREDLELCLAGGPLQSFSCLQARKSVLARHLTDMKSVQPKSWRLSWWLIDNPNVAASDRVQGVYMSARGDSKAQDRFTLVLPNGAEQTIILEYPLTERGEKARDLFRTSLRSLQVSPDLAQGIRWADHEIEHIRLDDLAKSSGPGELEARLARIQTVLIGKLSVDPKTYDTYFHLAGTASMLAGQATQGNREDLLGVARSLIQNLYYYARDVSPTDPRTPQLEKLWIQVKAR